MHLEGNYLNVCRTDRFMNKSHKHISRHRTSDVTRTLYDVIIEMELIESLPPPGATAPPVDQGLIIEASRSHSDIPHSVGLLWTSEQPDTTLTTDIHATGGIRTRSPSRRAAADRRLRPRDHWDRRRDVGGAH